MLIYTYYLQRMMALYVSSHYKNSPNDLQLMADAPAHHLFVLLGILVFHGVFFTLPSCDAYLSLTAYMQVLLTSQKINFLIYSVSSRFANPLRKTQLLPFPRVQWSLEPMVVLLRKIDFITNKRGKERKINEKNTLSSISYLCNWIIYILQFL